jgi:lambda family phage minor tail protein L
MSIQEAQQRLSVGKYVILYSLDLTDRGGTILYWTPSRPTADHPIIWRGNTYASVDVKFEGVEKNTASTLPRPRLTVGNADNLVTQLLVQFDDLRGCLIKRTKTLYEFLDDQPNANPDDCWPTDIFYVERKIVHNKNTVQMELASTLEQNRVEIPGRMVLKNTCVWQYRIYDATTDDFKYEAATCPYAGEACFTKLDVATTDKSKDQCGKRIDSCKKRFGATAELPFGAFPGLGRA